MEARGARLRRVGDGRLQRDHVPAVGRRCVDADEARGRPAPCAACAGHRVAGAGAHVLRHRHGAARSRGGRRRHRRARPPSRRVPVVGTGRAVGEHDRLGRARHPQADRPRRRHAGREEPDPEPGQGHAGLAGPAAEARTGPAGGRGVRSAPRPGRWRWTQREDPHVQLQAEPHHRPSHRSDGAEARHACWRATSTRSPTRSSTTSRRAGCPIRLSDGTTWRRLLDEASDRLGDRSESAPHRRGGERSRRSRARAASRRGADRAAPHARCLDDGRAARRR